MVSNLINHQELKQIIIERFIDAEIHYITNSQEVTLHLLINTEIIKPKEIIEVKNTHNVSNEQNNSYKILFLKLIWVNLFPKIFRIKENNSPQ